MGTLYSMHECSVNLQLSNKTKTLAGVVLQHRRFICKEMKITLITEYGKKGF